MKFHKLYIFSLLIALPIILNSCVEDKLNGPEIIGEGITDVIATVSFESFAPALASRAEGNAVHNIYDMMVLIYDDNENEEECKLVGKEYYSIDDMSNWSINQNGNDEIPDDQNKDYYDSDKKNPHETDETTPRATFRLHGISYGKYRMYVVANMGLLSDDKIASPAKLKSQLLIWDNVNVANNNQMFGYFTTALHQESEGFVAPLIVINQPGMNLHAWIKRAVSKVTIAFDTEKLKESIRIYIKKVTIYDIPRTCVLGADNKVNDAADLWPNEDNPQMIEYGKGDDYTQWLMLYHNINGQNTYGSNHSNTSEALFFYENMQGDFQGDPEMNKVMAEEVKFGDTPIREPGQKDFKDEVPLGTYIEVEGYYDSFNSDRITKGPIKYRFMLGKNVTYNYDAQRNHHYKLTLRLNGFANEADWHIDYVDEKPEIQAPDKYYISYLYNQEIGQGLPVRLAGKPLSLKAEIIENNWAPYDSITGTVPSTEDPGGEFYWNLKAYNDLNSKYNNWNLYRGHCNFVGFLSLRKTNQVSIDAGADSNGYGPETMTNLQNYYVNNKIWYVGPVDNVDQSEAGYDLIPTANGTKHNIDNDEKYGSYAVSKDEDGSVTVMVPMWTRAMSMAPMSGFSGNNPYTNYERKAVVRFTAEFDVGNGKIETRTKDVTILQVQRIVNPKAIWRSRENTENFEITLTNLLKPTDTKFTEFKSVGKWRVSVEKGNDWVKISDLNKIGPNADGYIFGSDNTPVKFNYQPAGKATNDRFGIIKIEYNDYSCVHYILVRQGYENDIRISASSNTLWSSKNVYAFVSKTGTATTSAAAIATDNINWINTITTVSPLSIGTYFKRGNYDYGFLESNNDTYGWEVSVQNRSLSTVHYTDNTTKQTRDAEWGTIWGVTSNTPDWRWASSLDEVRNGSGQGTPRYRVPSYDDFNSLKNSDVDFGFGVVYGDGATKTQLNLTDAYGFQDVDNNDNANNVDIKARGVRACIVYNKENAHQVLFPLSASGYGRRACRPMALNPAGTGLTFLAADRGILIYSGVTCLLTNNWASLNWYRPINYNLRYNAGATYWINQRRAGGHLSDGDSSYAWDINYFNYDFGGYDSSTLGGDADAARSSDAMPIKLVRTAGANE